MFLGLQTLSVMQTGEFTTHQFLLDKTIVVKDGDGESWNLPAGSRMVVYTVPERWTRGLDTIIEQHLLEAHFSFGIISALAGEPPNTIEAFTAEGLAKQAKPDDEIPF